MNATPPTETRVVGSVASLWRYPVKSMMGEELNASVVTGRGLLGDRAYALIDRETGKVVSAKEPRKWAKLFEFRSSYVDSPGGNGLPPVRITLPDGVTVTSERSELEQVLSGMLGREVGFAESAPEEPSLEEYWPDIEGLALRENRHGRGDAGRDVLRFRRRPPTHAPSGARPE